MCYFWNRLRERHGFCQTTDNEHLKATLLHKEREEHPPEPLLRAQCYSLVLIMCSFHWLDLLVCAVGLECLKMKQSLIRHKLSLFEWMGASVKCHTNQLRERQPALSLDFCDFKPAPSPTPTHWSTDWTVQKLDLSYVKTNHHKRLLWQLQQKQTTDEQSAEQSSSACSCRYREPAFVSS